MSDISLISTSKYTYFVPAYDTKLPDLLLRDDGWMPETMDWLFAAIKHFYSEGRSPVFVDVGANVGTTTIQALERFDFQKILSIEANSLVYACLKASLALNHKEDRVVTVNSAVGDFRGELTLMNNPKNCGGNRVAAASGGTAGWERELVSCFTLDELVYRHGIGFTPYCLWIDVEGFEAKVLAGAPTLLSYKPPIFMEFWPSQLQGPELLFKIVEEHYIGFLDAEELPAFDTFQPIHDLRRLYEDRREHCRKNDCDWATDIFLIK